MNDVQVKDDIFHSVLEAENVQFTAKTKARLSLARASDSRVRPEIIYRGIGN